jgi:hypothetical protein
MTQHEWVFIVWKIFNLKVRELIIFSQSGFKKITSQTMFNEDVDIFEVRENDMPL